TSAEAPGQLSVLNADHQERADGRASGEPELGQDEERRALPRRRGNPVGVLICPSDVPGSPFHGWVVDRSPEGLCIVAEEAVPIAVWLRVRPTDHPAGTDWFEGEV